MPEILLLVLCLRKTSMWVTVLRDVLVTVIAPTRGMQKLLVYVDLS